ncbi:MAG TPA: hypothetical protein VGO03_16330 [Acidimicrobiia bacterium]|jgi:hypothetical protein
MGWLIVLASVALGIYIQTSIPFPGDEGGQLRAVYTLTALVPFAIGILVIAVGHLVLLRESESSPPRRTRLSSWLMSDRPERA